MLLRLGSVLGGFNQWSARCSAEVSLPQSLTWIVLSPWPAITRWSWYSPEKAIRNRYLTTVGAGIWCNAPSRWRLDYSTEVDCVWIT